MRRDRGVSDRTCPGLLVAIWCCSAAVGSAIALRVSLAMPLKTTEIDVDTLVSGAEAETEARCARPLRRELDAPSALLPDPGHPDFELARAMWETCCSPR